jgi:ABC-type lipoprotein release transport system permease subunit
VRLLRIVSTLAWRNLWRNHRRTLIMISAIVVGVWAMIFMTALMRGMVNDMIRDGVESLPGHVQIHHSEFRDDPSVDNLIALTDSELTKRLDIAAVNNWSSRINVPAVITSERETRGVTLYGVDPEKDGDVTFVANNIVAGRYLEDASDGGVVIGRKLLDTLETRLGKRIVVMSQDPDNEIADRGFRIVGVFDAKLEIYEETMLFAGKKTVQDMLGIGDRVTEVAIMGDDYRDVEPLLQAVRKQFGTGVEVLPWYELNSYLGAMLGVMDGFILVWTVVIFLALSFGLVNTLVMAVFERVREIGLMLALGMRPVSILAQVVIESLLLLVIGLAVGTLLAWLTILPLESGIDISIVAEGMEMFGSSSILYPELTIEDVVLANVVVLVLGFLASLSPAWRASRYDPIEALTKV